MKQVLIVIFSVVAVFLTIGLFTKKEFVVEKEIEINQSQSEVFNYLKYLKNQDNYSVWSRMDSNMLRSFEGEDATVGFISRWESKLEEVGKGEQEIIAISRNDLKPNQQIEFEIRFYEPFRSKYNAQIVTEPINDKQTKVKWGFKGRMEYPSNLFLLFINMEDALGPDLQQGLQNLKIVLEK